VVVETAIVLEGSPGETALVVVGSVAVPMIVVGVDDVAVVAVVGVEPAVVEPAVVEPVAITGEMGELTGAEDAMPVGALSFGYGLHTRLRLLPDTFSVRSIAGSTVRVMAPPVAVNGPTVPGVEGRFSVMPVDGIGLGRGALMAISPAESDAGVAPVASTLTTAVPAIAVFPSAWAADAMDEGRVTCVWKLDKLNP